MNEVVPITLVVACDDGDLKMVWHDDGPNPPYHVSYGDLQTEAEAVRRALQRLVDTAIRLQVDGSAAMPKASLAAAVKRLAKAGSALHERIFNGLGMGANIASEMKRHVATSHARITVSTKERVHIPWGLAYAGDPELLHDDDDVYSESFFERCKDFWCIRYATSTLYNLIMPFAVADRPRSSVRTLNVINTVAWTKAEAAYRCSPGEANARAAFFGERVTNNAEFFSTWKARHAELDLLYVYAHSDPVSLMVESGKPVCLNVFTEKIRHDPPQSRPVCLVFLNGCSTAIGDDKTGGFLRATGQQGFCGFIGANAKIPDIFAQRFATVFLAELLNSGDPVWLVMHRMRREHWPLSLIYDSCCHPRFRIEPDPDRRTTELWNCPNLSAEMPIATETLGRDC